MNLAQCRLTAPRISGVHGVIAVCAAEFRHSRWLGRASRANRRMTIRGAVETTRSGGSTTKLSGRGPLRS